MRSRRRKAFGPAADFYRARVRELTEQDTEELIWEEGVGYLTPEPAAAPEPHKVFIVELVRLADSQTFEIGRFDRRREADIKYEEVRVDVETMERAEIETAYGLQKEPAEES